ncbi:alpha-1,2-fucosyltransferase [Mucilaginibacter angelicae]|uniref:Alpha-1,2-fucosyltransferase n=1 Tax=Mucilaginibacter angelicae TaxID=869718 RepID=A0ABV6L546_9SPHI
MVGITIDCRLGNQLFQYAFIRALAVKLGTRYFVNENIEKFIAADYFDIGGYHPILNYVNKLYFKLSCGSLFKSLQSTPVGDYEPGSFRALKDREIYRGYFQSELFFENIIPGLASHIRVKKHIAARFGAEYASLFQNNRVVAVHIRRGDYLGLNDWWAENLGSNDLSLPAAYYLDSLEQVSGRERYKVIFVSDDIDFARSAFSHIPGALFAGADMMTDFQILMNADVCIISNSSFAWWAAYLNTKKDKQVFCPKYWLGFKIKKEYPEGIIPAQWKQVAVNH